MKINHIVFLLLTALIFGVVIVKIFTNRSQVANSVEQINKPNIVNEGNNIKKIKEEPVNASDSLPIPKTYNESVQIAQQNQKQLFLIFSAEWCKPCNDMKRNVWSDSKVKDRLSNYVVYKVNVDKERDEANRYGIRTLPTYGVYDISSGSPKPIKVASGGKTAQGLIAWLND